MNQTEALKELSRLCLAVAEGKQLQVKYSEGWDDAIHACDFLTVGFIDRLRLKPEPRKLFIGVYSTDGGDGGIYHSAGTYMSEKHFRDSCAGFGRKPLSFFEHTIEEKS